MISYKYLIPRVLLFDAPINQLLSGLGNFLVELSNQSVLETKIEVDTHMMLVQRCFAKGTPLTESKELI